MPLPHPFRLAVLAAVALGSLALAGCGGGGGGTLYPVKGKVTVAGKPLTKGTVRFVPDKTKGNTAGVEPVGAIAADGSYALSTGGTAGAPPGWYKVTVSATDEPDSTKPNAAKSYVGKIFNAAETTPISIEVVSAPAPDAYDVKAGAPAS